nr:HD-GYP domain-containing protein [uncultured Holophaga sp.]
MSTAHPSPDPLGLRIDIHAFIESFVHTLEARDSYTAGHSQRVSDLAGGLAGELRLPPRDILSVHIAGDLHDIGKVGIPDGILLKSGPLSSSEREIMQGHPLIGHDILKGVAGLEGIARMVLHHHERFDGRGYPGCLKGEAIPLGARILAIADSYDAMTSNRTYRPVKSHGSALEEIWRERGRQFDPYLAACFCALQQDALRRIA